MVEVSCTARAASSDRSIPVVDIIDKQRCFQEMHLQRRRRNGEKEKDETEDVTRAAPDRDISFVHLINKQRCFEEAAAAPAQATAAAVKNSRQAPDRDISFVDLISKQRCFKTEESLERNRKQKKKKDALDILDEKSFEEYVTFDDLEAFVPANVAVLNTESGDNSIRGGRGDKFNPFADIDSLHASGKGLMEDFEDDSTGRNDDDENDDNDDVNAQSLQSDCEDESSNVDRSNSECDASALERSVRSIGADELNGQVEEVTNEVDGMQKEHGQPKELGIRHRNKTLISQSDHTGSTSRARSAGALAELFVDGKDKNDNDKNSNFPECQKKTRSSVANQRRRRSGGNDSKDLDESQSSLSRRPRSKSNNALSSTRDRGRKETRNTDLVYPRHRARSGPSSGHNTIGIISGDSSKKDLNIFSSSSYHSRDQRKKVIRVSVNQYMSKEEVVAAISEARMKASSSGGSVGGRSRKLTAERRTAEKNSSGVPLPSTSPTGTPTVTPKRRTRKSSRLLLKEKVQADNQFREALYGMLERQISEKSIKSH